MRTSHPVFQPKDTPVQVHTPLPDPHGSRHPGAKPERGFADEARFLRNWLKNPLVAGAVSPSGRALARTMARCVDPLDDGPVIELGPGTGPVTEALLAHGVAQHRLVLVEFDRDFCRLLARRFPLACVIQGDAYDLATTLHGQLHAPAAAIVSSLPLLTKPETQRRALLEAAMELAQPDAPFIQFTYGVAPPIPRKLSSPDFAYYAQGSSPVWLNLPPARVWVYHRGTAADGASKRTRADELMHSLRVRGVKVRRDFRRAAGKLQDRVGKSLRD